MIRCLAWITAGLLFGLLLAQMRPRAYVAETTLYFPPFQSEMFRRLTDTLDSDALGKEEFLQPISDGDELCRLAGHILRSQGAAEAAVASVQSGSPERLMANLTLSQLDPNTIRLSLRSTSIETARSQLDSLTGYYSDFVKKHETTRARFARNRAQERLKSVAVEVAELEDKLSRTSSTELRRLADSARKANPKVRSQLWLRRAEQSAGSHELLVKLEKIRGTSKESVAQLEAGWFPGRGRSDKAGLAAGLIGPVNVQDLIQRTRLERAYSDALVRHRSAVMLYSFLLSWDDLQSAEFQVLDPLNVKAAPRPYLLYAMAGGSIAGLIWAAANLRRKSLG